MSALDIVTGPTAAVATIWWKMLAALLGSVFYGVLVMFLYRHYHRVNEPYDLSMSRSFPLIAPSVTALFWLIQYSLPLSLGLLGALSFVRFRSPVKRAEDIGFILMIVGGALACSVNQYLMAFSLISIVGIYGCIRRRISDKSSHTSLGNLAIHSEDDTFLDKWEKLGKEETGKFGLVSLAAKDSLVSLFFHSSSMKASDVGRIRTLIRQIDPMARAEFFFPDNQVGI
jgi:hypothetical protein